MLCGSPATSTHPHSVPSIQGHPGYPSFRLQGKRQFQSFILMSLLSRVMTRTRQETRSFSVKTQLPGLGPRGLLPHCRSQLLLRLQMRQDSTLSSFSSLPSTLLRACPGLSFPKRKAMSWPLMAATGASRQSVLGRHPDLGSLSSSPSHHSQAK